MEKQKRVYSTDFKMKAVELSRLRGSSAQVASELDISPKNLSRWKQEYEAGKLDGSTNQARRCKNCGTIRNHRPKKSIA